MADVGISEYRRINWNKMCKLLFEYCNKKGKYPKSTTKYKGFNIGSWLMAQKREIKSAQNNKYKKLCKNKYIRQALDKNLEYKQQKSFVNNMISTLFEYCNKHQEVPDDTTIYKNIQIGEWFKNERSKIYYKHNRMYKKMIINKFVKRKLDERMGKSA